MHGKPKRVKLLKKAILSLFCFLCLFPAWKSDATKLNPSGMRVLWPGRPGCQQTKSVQGERFHPREAGSLVYCQTHTQIPPLKNLWHKRLISLSKQGVTIATRAFEYKTQYRWYGANITVYYTCSLFLSTITSNTQHHQHGRNETNGNGLVIVVRGPCCKKYQQCYHT